MAEGAGILILEEYTRAATRGARIYGELIGYGATADAHHITDPCPDGDGMARAMETALRDARISPEEIHYVNTHGTSTMPGDPAETKALKRAFGASVSKLAASSTKSVTGHMLGAAGAVESIACLCAMRDNVAPPTANLENQDPECDLDYIPITAREMPIKTTLTNSFGFGGHNATLIYRKVE
jgi:3-oxoacyl-[acyl-carrier-protein] synthase II